MAQDAALSESELMETIGPMLESASSERDPTTRDELIRRVLTQFGNNTLKRLADFYGPQLKPPVPASFEEPVEQGTAEIYSFALEEKLVHLVRYGSALQLYEVEVARERLSSAIRYFIQELQISSSFGGMERASSGLHRWVVQPFLADLEQAGVETLVFVTSDTLLPLPLSTLFDSRRYLIDDFQVVRSFGMMTPGVQRTEQAALVEKLSSLDGLASGARDEDFELTALQNEILISQSNRVINADFPVMALISGHLVTGAAINLVSLWPINDGARAQLLDLFQGELAAGASPSAALRTAQLEFRSSSRYGHPFLWGGFMVVDW